MDELLKPSVVSRRFDISEATLRRWRSIGQGPTFLRVGRQVRYRVSDVEDWLAKQCHPTGDVA